MREARRFTLGFLFLVTLTLLSVSHIPLVHADADAVDESSTAGAEAVVDAAGDVQVEEPESSTADEDTAAMTGLAEAAIEATKRAAAQLAAAEAAADEASKIAEEAEKEKSTAFVGDVAESAKSKAVLFFDKAKEVTPEQMKKVAAGAVGVWGVAAGAGWVMNNLGGVEE